MLERIVQVSRAAAGLRQEDVYDIIRTAHAANRLAGLSGGLIFLDGWFAQVLEGAPGRRSTPASTGSPATRGTAASSGAAASGRSAGSSPARRWRSRSRACLDPALLEAFGWRPGFPVAGFPADVLVEFVVQACHPRACRRAPAAPPGLRAVS